VSAGFAVGARGGCAEPGGGNAPLRGRGFRATFRARERTFGALPKRVKQRSTIFFYTLLCEWSLWGAGRPLRGKLRGTSGGGVRNRARPRNTTAMPQRRDRLRCRLCGLRGRGWDEYNLLPLRWSTQRSHIVRRSGDAAWVTHRNETRHSFPMGKGSAQLALEAQHFILTSRCCRENRIPILPHSPL